MMSFKSASLLCLIFLLMITGALGNQWSVKYNQLKLCALNGSTVFMNGSYTHPADHTVNNTFWIINPVYRVEQTDLCNESGYSGRVKYLGDEQKHFSLRLSDVKKTDERMYYFRIRTNTNGWIGKPGVILNVTDLQVIAPAEVTEGEPVTLTCNTTCSLTDPTFIWYINTPDLPTKTSKSHEVHLQRVSSEDAGSYSCAVRGYEHLRSPAHNLRVRYPPKSVSVSISASDTIVEGGSVTLTCSSNANRPVQNYTWFKGKTSVGTGKTYTISNISSEDRGEYKCKCSNEVGHQESSGVTLNVLYPPKSVSVSISPSGVIFNGGSVTLTCSSDANPPVQNYTWFKGNESSPVGSGQSYRALPSGQYYCEAQNEHGSERSAEVSVTINELQIVGVYAGVGVVVFLSVCLIVTFLFIRKYKKTGSTADRSVKQDNVYDAVAVTDPINTGSDSTSTNQDEILYASVVRRPATDPENAEGSTLKASASADEEVQYASVRFTRPGAEYRTANDEDPAVIYSGVK